MIKNYGGPVFKIYAASQISGLNVNGVEFAVHTYPIFSEAAGQGKIKDSSFCNNTIFGTGAVAAPLIELQTIGSATAGNKCSNNTFYFDSASTLPSSLFKGDLSRSEFSGNNVRSAVANSVPVLDASCTLTDAIIRDNIGWGGRSLVMVDAGADVSCERPYSADPVLWLVDGVTPSNMVDGDILIDNG